LPKRTRSFESLGYAIRAIRKEVFGFQFAYPLEVVSEAGSRDSLHYYLYSDSLSWEAMRLDGAGIPRTWDRTSGTNYWPGYIAWYGLVNLGHYRGQVEAESELRGLIEQACLNIVSRKPA
jgi:hypothetical protein